jgi:hypothetical protein
MSGALPASTAAQIYWSHHLFRRGQPESSAAPLPIQLGSHASGPVSEPERSMPEPRLSHSVLCRPPGFRQGAAALPQRQSRTDIGSRACLAARASCVCRWARRPVFSAPLWPDHFSGNRRRDLHAAVATQRLASGEEFSSVSVVRHSEIIDEEHATASDTLYVNAEASRQGAQRVRLVHASRSRGARRHHPRSDAYRDLGPESLAADIEWRHPGGSAGGWFLRLS